jgi:K+-sensing histidine kinase KdpD
VDQSAEQRGWVMILREVSRIRQLQRKKMQLLAQAADGLQAPLAEAIQSLLELNELPEEADERFTGSVQRGMQNLGAIRSWTEEVLALVTFEAGQEAAQDPLPLSQLVGEFESASNDEVFEGKQLQLEVEISEAVKVKVEPKPARRLLQHLVRQAAWRSKVNSQIKVILEEDDRQTWLKVRDEADKLMEADDPTLFDQFMATQGEELEGIALSLAMIKTTVDVLGGQLWMWSDDDGGNTFAVALPHRAGDQTE